MKTIGVICTFAFIATVWAANWAIGHWPDGVTVAPGLTAPAGVYLAGLAFTLRDIVHRTLGRRIVLVAILAGCALAYWVGGNVSISGGYLSIAVASALAFLLSELADLTVYTPARKRGWLPAVLASNTVGIIVDSALFLWLAFGSLAFFWGQVVGKAWVTLATVGVLLTVQVLRHREAVPA